MSVPRLSESNENYVKAVWSLTEWSQAPAATPSAIAARVGVRQSTASDAIKKLAELGLVDHSRYGAVSLTAEGQRLAIALVRRHRLIETFLVEMLGYSWDQVHDEAEVLEHAVSDFMVERLDEVLGHPTRDPHGDPIPTADGIVDRLDVVRLSEVGEGRRVRVERIADDDPSLLRHLADNGIGVGSLLATSPGAPHSGTLTIDAGSGPLPLGPTATEAIHVQPVQEN